MQIHKAAGLMEAGTPNVQQLELINRHSKTDLQAEEVYIFAVRLCDDRPDRDHERFAKEALYDLAPMFIGKTGILDHEWSTDRQLGRIFDTQVIQDGESTWLKAWVYMLRTEKTAELIREIEGGIKKEVSVGCAVGRTLCSICGEDYGDCSHRKGEYYGGKLCTAVLCDPTDAYEFSFVAVPAQKQAGVVKAADPDALQKAKLEKEAEYGRMYRKMLQKDVVKMGLLLQLGLEEKLLRKMAEGLTVEELISLQTAFSRKTAERLPLKCQLSNPKETVGSTDSAFLI